MGFEYSPDKSELNKEKHGIDFEEAKAIWGADNVILPAITKGERRYMIIGKIDEEIYSCIFTMRERNVRIISCRKSRDKEKRIYHGKIQEENKI